MINKAQDKTYIFRKFFGFDVFSLCFQLSKIVKTDNLDLYIFKDIEINRIGNNVIAWMNFYETWIESEEEIVPLFTKFISDPYGALEEVYLTSNSYMQAHIDKCIRFNKKEDVNKAFTEGLIRQATP